MTSETYFSTCGSCRHCRDGRIQSVCRAPIYWIGSKRRIYVVPGGAGQKHVHCSPRWRGYLAGALTEPLACVVHGALEMTKVLPGDFAVVAGPGAIGLLTMQTVKAAGARVLLIGTEADEHRLSVATELGADAIAVAGRDDVERMVLETTDGGADIVYECSGAGAAAQTLLRLVRRGGQYAQIGLFGKPVAWDLDQICYKELSVTGSNASVPSAWDRALALLAGGAVITEPLVTGTYPVTEWRAAFDTFDRRVRTQVGTRARVRRGGNG